MLGTKIINPVEKKALALIGQNEARGTVSHRVFKNIRNREAVMNTLEREGFVADDSIKPRIWRRAAKPRKHTPDQEKKDDKPLCQQVIDTLKNDGELYKDDLPIDKYYLVAVISQLRKKGHDIKALTNDGRLMGYKLSA